MSKDKGNNGKMTFGCKYCSSELTTKHTLQEHLNKCSIKNFLESNITTKLCHYVRDNKKVTMSVGEMISFI